MTDLPLFQPRAVDPQVDDFLALLAEFGHLTRAQFQGLRGWNDRTVRALAAEAGPKVVRGQKGFCLTQNANLDETREAAEASIAQGKKMIRYGLQLKRQLHGQIERNK
ncbi:MAG: hypothetical protein VW338_08685 [Rhodospirillaceae bacterium]